MYSIFFKEWHIIVIVVLLKKMEKVFFEDFAHTGHNVIICKKKYIYKKKNIYIYRCISIN